MTAKKLLAAFESSSFDAVVTDISLPGMSGTDFARTILRTHPLQLGRAVFGLRPDGRLSLVATSAALLKPFDLDQMETLMADIAASARAGW